MFRCISLSYDSCVQFFDRFMKGYLLLIICLVCCLYVKGDKNCSHLTQSNTTAVQGSDRK